MSYLWLVILEFRPSNPEKTGGLALNRSVWEQALPDLTASILAIFPLLSNMFLHNRQVIDSRAPNERFEAESYGSSDPLDLLSS